jgi:hypothetical protein
MTAGGMTMNCDEYRAALGAEPGSDVGKAHRDACADCQEYYSEMLALDAHIRRALAIKVPEFVAPEFDAIAADNVVSLTAPRRFLAPSWLAVAATVLLAVIVGVRLGNVGSISADALAAEVLAHVTHEPLALQVTDLGVPEDRLREVVPANLAAMDNSAGLITFAATCPINGNEIPHLVIQGKTGPVTILLLPEEKISKAIELNDELSHGVILPVGDGSVAIIGTKEEPLENIQEQVLKSVSWKT